MCWKAVDSVDEKKDGKEEKEVERGRFRLMEKERELRGNREKV